MLYVGSEPEYQLMHNTQGAGPPACRQTDGRADGGVAGRSCSSLHDAGYQRLARERGSSRFDHHK